MNPRWLVGKVIAKVEMNPFDDGRGLIAHNPVITFTDGSAIAFTTEETEIGEYGTAISYRRKNRALTANQ